jgi:hypothetical protein
MPGELEKALHILYRDDQSCCVDQRMALERIFIPQIPVNQQLHSMIPVIH